MASMDMLPQALIDAEIEALHARHLERMAVHFGMLDREDDFVPVAGRFVLLHCGYEEGMPGPEWGYVTSWDTFEEARAAALPVAPGFRLVDDKTGTYWEAGGIYQ